MSEARAGFAKVLKRAQAGEPVEVTRAGRPVAVVVSVEQFRAVAARAPSPAEALRGFLAELGRRALEGPDPWAKVRDRSPGRAVEP